MINLPNYVKEILQKLNQNGYEAYAVGGCVRDLLLSRTPADFDITTNCLPEKVKTLFDNTLDIGIKHGTVTVITDFGPVEITTYRNDGKYLNHRKPDNVEFVANLAEDLSRRDFTVNAMAADLNGNLIDKSDGLSDLKNKIIRAIGDPETRFEEDALRILRAFRFMAKLGFKIEANTLAAASQKADLLDCISRERIFSELLGILKENCSNSLSLAAENGVLKTLGIVGNIDFDIIEHLPNSPNLRLYAFLILSEVSDIKSVLKHLKTSKKTIQYCETITKISEFLITPSKIGLKHALNIADRETILDAILFCSLKNKKSPDIYKTLLDEIIISNEPYKIADLKIDGNDLLTLGIPPEKIGEKLKMLLETVLENPKYNTKEKLLSLV